MIQAAGQNQDGESSNSGDQSSESKQIKSRESRKRVPLHIVNTTHHSVDIIWLDFNGNEVTYAKGLKSGDRFAVATFETHPWIFRDHESRRKLAIVSNLQSKKLSKSDIVKYPDKIMIPEAIYNDGQTLPILAMVTYPIDSLRDMCFLRLCRLGLSLENIKNVDIPVSLREEFCSFWKDWTPLRLYLQQPQVLSR